MGYSFGGAPYMLATCLDTASREHSACMQSMQSVKKELCIDIGYSFGGASYMLRLRSILSLRSLLSIMEARAKATEHMQRQQLGRGDLCQITTARCSATCLFCLFLPSVLFCLPYCMLCKPLPCGPTLSALLLLTARRISCRFAHVIACFAAVVLPLFPVGNIVVWGLISNVL